MLNQLHNDDLSFDAQQGFVRLLDSKVTNG